MDLKCNKLHLIWTYLNHVLKWEDNSQTFKIMIQSTMIPWVFFYVFAICEPGERVANQFNEFGMKFERCEWSKLSAIGMQQMYLIFLSDTQHPRNLQTYGGIQCTRDTFKRVQTSMKNGLAPTKFTIHFDFSDNNQRIFIFHDTSQLQGIDRSRMKNEKWRKEKLAFKKCVFFIISILRALSKKEAAFFLRKMKC